MARLARGVEVLDMAQEMILRAKTIEELRQAGGSVAAGLRVESGADCARDRAFGGVDLSITQSVPGG